MIGMKSTRPRGHPLGRYWRILQRPVKIAIDLEMHVLLVVYASKHNYTLREAANRTIAIGLKVELDREDARKKREETEDLLK